MSVDGAWLIVAVMIARFLLHKSPKYFRKILWGLVGIRLLLPFSVESIFSLMPREINDAGQTVSQRVTDTVTQQHTFSLMDALPYAWVIIGCVLIVYGIISFVKLKYKIFDAVIYKDNIYLSEKAESPFVYGLVKPKIYIPYNLDDKTRDCILQHENTHIKYADHILKLVGYAILCIHWFNPLVWASYFLFCKDIELACDESVIKKYDKDSCREYAKALLDIGVNRVRFSACPIAFGEVSIKERIKSVMGYKKAGRILVSVSLGLCVAVGLCFMTEPEAQAREKIEDAVIEETAAESITELVNEVETTRKTSNEPHTEKVTEPETELHTEMVTEPLREASTTYEALTEPYTETVTEPVGQHFEELYDDSIFENEADGLYNDPLNDINVLEPERVEVSKPTSIYEGVTYNNFGSNSSVIGTKTTSPTEAYIIWDPVVTQSSMHNNGGNTNRPHFEGNRWVYN